MFVCSALPHGDGTPPLHHILLLIGPKTSRKKPGVEGVSVSFDDKKGGNTHFHGGHCWPSSHPVCGTCFARTRESNGDATMALSIIFSSPTHVLPNSTVILKLTLRHKTNFTSFSELSSLISLPSNLPPWK